MFRLSLSLSFSHSNSAARQKCKEKNTKIDRDTGDNGDKSADQQN
jgi:hypothetical protein